MKNLILLLLMFLLSPFIRPLCAQQTFESVNIEAVNLLADSINAPIFPGGDTALFEIIFNKLYFIKQDTRLIDGSRKFIEFFIEVDPFGRIAKSKLTDISKSYYKNFNKIFPKLTANLDNWIPAFKKNDKKTVRYILLFYISVTKETIKLNIYNIDSQILMTTSRRINSIAHNKRKK